MTKKEYINNYQGNRFYSIKPGHTITYTFGELLDGRFGNAWILWTDTAGTQRTDYSLDLIEENLNKGEWKILKEGELFLTDMLRKVLTIINNQIVQELRFVNTRHNDEDDYPNNRFNRTISKRHIDEYLKNGSYLLTDTPRLNYLREFYMKEIKNKI